MVRDKQSTRGDPRLHVQKAFRTIVHPIDLPQNFRLETADQAMQNRVSIPAKSGEYSEVQTARLEGPEAIYRSDA